jgi:cytochrome c
MSNRRSRKKMYSWMLTSVITVAMTAVAATSHAAEETGTEQAAQGGKLYADHCAKCHGAEGQGTKKAPPLVGKDALPLDPRPSQKVRKGQFHTAQDVAQFASTKMPPKKPGSLTSEQYYDIIAFALKANGVDVSNKKIDATTTAAIKLH